jgi:putative redox protein
VARGQEIEPFVVRRSVDSMETPMADNQDQHIVQKGTVIVADTGAGKFQVLARTSAGAFLVDEPLSVGGLGTGPDPYDLLSAALGACTVMTMRLYANQKSFNLDRASVSVRHHREASGRDVFLREISLEGALDDDQIKRIMSIAERCPVHLTLTRGADVRTCLALASRMGGPQELS